MKTRPALVFLVIVAGEGCSDAGTSTSPVPPPPSSYTAHVAYCEFAQPVWVAFQDGDGAWRQSLPTRSGGRVVYAHTFTSDRGAIARVFLIGPEFTSLAIQYGAPTELEQAGDTNPASCSLFPQTLFGRAAGLDSDQFVSVSGSYFSQQAPAGPSEEFILQLLPTGPTDVVATRRRRGDGGNRPDKIILRRGITLADRATLPLLDFNSAEAFAPAVRNVRLLGTGIAGAAVSSRLTTANFDGELAASAGQDTSAIATYLAVPQEQLLPGELQRVVANTQGVAPGSRLSASVYFHTPVDLTLTFGEDVIAPAISTVDTTPALRLRARFAPQSAYDRAAIMQYQQGDGASVIMSMTAAYAALVGGYDLTIPDLSGVAGFQTHWALRPGFGLRASAVRIGGTLDLGANAIPRAGDTQRTGQLDDVVVP